MSSPSNRLLTEAEAALYLGCSTRTLKRLRARRQIPFYLIRANGSRGIIRYQKFDLQRWLAPSSPSSDSIFIGSGRLRK